MKAPGQTDWKTFVRYNERVRRITYDERSAALIVPMLAENKPQDFILPFLEELTWRAQSSAGLAHCQMFLNPRLRTFELDISVRVPQLDSFLQMVANHTRLTTFSFNSPTTLPDSFPHLFQQQDMLEMVVLVAPGALSPGIGRWLASLTHLTHLQLDLSGRSMMAIEGFFEELFSRSGYSTPSSMASSDSEDELDFSEIRKSALRLTGDLPPRRIYPQLRKLQLTGQVSNIAVFLKHITSPLTHTEFVIEDPPDRADWQDLCLLICERFRETLTSLRILATSSSRFADLMRATPRGEPASNHLDLKHLTSLPNLLRLEIDLPESVVFTSADLASLAQASPKLESLRLCPLAKFSTTVGPPQISLEDLAILLRACRNLHTVSAVFNATPISEDSLKTPQVSSNSLLRLQVGHSWISDPLQVAISVSHLAPRLEAVKWLQDKTRTGYVETNAKHWQTLADLLPHFQKVRLIERTFTRISSPVVPPPKKVKKVNKCVGRTVVHVDRSVDAQPFTVNAYVQAAPQAMHRAVEAIPMTFSVTVDATPVVSCASIDATTTVQDQGIDATEIPTPKLTPVPAVPKKDRTLIRLTQAYALFSFFYRVFVMYPFEWPSRVLHHTTDQFRRWSQGLQQQRKRSLSEANKGRLQNGRASNGSAHATIAGDEIALGSLQVGHDRPRL